MGSAVIVASLGLLLLASPLSAQTVGRLSIVGTIEYARITEDDGFLGAGAGAAGGVQLQLTDGTSVALEMGAERHVRLIMRRQGERWKVADLFTPALPHGLVAALDAEIARGTRH